jgi:hypothetical protein
MNTLDIHSILAFNFIVEIDTVVCSFPVYFLFTRAAFESVDGIVLIASVCVCMLVCASYHL